MYFFTFDFCLLSRNFGFRTGLSDQIFLEGSSLFKLKSIITRPVSVGQQPSAGSDRFQTSSPHVFSSTQNYCFPTIISPAEISFFNKVKTTGSLPSPRSHFGIPLLRFTPANSSGDYIPLSVVCRRLQRPHVLLCVSFQLKYVKFRERYANNIEL